MKNWLIGIAVFFIFTTVMTVALMVKFTVLDTKMNKLNNDFLQLEENQEVLQYNFKQIAGAIERATIICKTQ